MQGMREGTHRLASARRANSTHYVLGQFPSNCGFKLMKAIQRAFPNDTFFSGEGSVTGGTPRFRLPLKDLKQ